MPVRRVTVVAAAATIALTALAGTALASSLAEGAPSAPAPGLASGTSPVVVLPPTPTSAPTTAPTTTPSTPDDSAAPSPSPLPDDAPPAQQLTADQAGQLAVAIVSGGVVREVGSEHEHGRLEWEVDVRLDGVEHDLHIDAVTGEVREHDVDDRDDDDDDHRVGTPQADDNWDD